MCPCCVSQISALLALHVSLNNRASHLHPSTSCVNSSIRSLEFSDLTIFCSTMKVMSYGAPNNEKHVHQTTRHPQQIKTRMRCQEHNGPICQSQRKIQGGRLCAGFIEVRRGLGALAGTTDDTKNMRGDRERRQGPRSTRCDVGCISHPGNVLEKHNTSWQHARGLKRDQQTHSSDCDDSLFPVFSGMACCVPWTRWIGHPCWGIWALSFYSSTVLHS